MANNEVGAFNVALLLKILKLVQKYGPVVQEIIDQLTGDDHPTVGAACPDEVLAAVKCLCEHANKS